MRSHGPHDPGSRRSTALAASVREGKGSLGKLVRDDTAYQSLMSLTRRGERTFSAMEDDLAALKRTWPLSRYFDARAYFEREKVLFQPGSRRASRSFRAEDLFEPGQAILTPLGHTRLDEVGRWCKQASRPGSEVVIAAFTDDDRDLDLAEALTQEQADAVRSYLVAQARNQLGRLVPNPQDRRSRLRHAGSQTSVSGSGAVVPASRRDHCLHPPDLIEVLFMNVRSRDEPASSDTSTVSGHPRRAGVVGAGQMGTGIAAAFWFEPAFRPRWST